MTAPRSEADRALAVIDAGLQRSPEPAMAGPDLTRCNHCGRAEPELGRDHCAPCRAFLLGDSDRDPAADAGADVFDAWAARRFPTCSERPVVVHVAVDTEAARSAFMEAGERIRDLGRSIQSAAVASLGVGHALHAAGAAAERSARAERRPGR